MKRYANNTPGDPQPARGLSTLVYPSEQVERLVRAEASQIPRGYLAVSPEKRASQGRL
jgi:hypothetical protein